jgi:phage host-nuclease inhibitor protein Gam
MSFNQKNVLGLLAGIVGLAAIKSATGPKSSKGSRIWYHIYGYAKECLEQAGGNAHRAKQICRQKYASHGEDVVQLICENIDELAQKGSMAKVPKGKDGFSREQDLAYFRYKMNKPKFAGAAPDFSERNAKMGELQGEMQSAMTNIFDLKAAIQKQTTEQVQAQLDELQANLNNAKEDLTNLEDQLALTNKLPTQAQGGLKGTTGVVEERRKLNAKIVDAKALVQKLDNDLVGFDRLFRFSGAISAQDKAKAQADLAELNARMGILTTEVQGIKNAMKAQQQAYDERVGTDMTFEQYAEATYQRPYGEMSDRYGTTGPAARAWAEFSDKMGPFSQSQKPWNPDASTNSWSDAGDLKSDSYSDGDASWTGTSPTNSWDSATGFSGKKLPDMPKFR